jgi:hypothetical protein
MPRPVISQFSCCVNAWFAMVTTTSDMSGRVPYGYLLTCGECTRVWERLEISGTRDDRWLLVDEPEPEREPSPWVERATIVPWSLARVTRRDGETFEHALYRAWEAHEHGNDGTIGADEAGEDDESGEGERPERAAGEDDAAAGEDAT